jgi:hypothetical protein
MWPISHVKRNKGAGGIDDMTVEELGPYLKENNVKKLVEELRSESYQPQPVKRVEIPKPDGSNVKLRNPNGRRPCGSTSVTTATVIPFLNRYFQIIVMVFDHIAVRKVL